MRDLRTRLLQVPALAVDDDPGWARPPADGGRHSAVLMLFGEGADPTGGPDVLLTERSRTLRSHAGQVSFPGGALDPTDDGAVGAALREATEETGLDPTGVEVIGVLPAIYLPPSRYVVTPVLAWWTRASAVAPVDAAEVASVVRAPLRELADPANRVLARHPSGFVGPAFRVQGLYVWGFTAGLLARVLHLAGVELGWDATPTEDLPDDIMALLP